jgi:hypothetical protein
MCTLHRYCIVLLWCYVWYWSHIYLLSSIVIHCMRYCCRILLKLSLTRTHRCHLLDSISAVLMSSSCWSTIWSYLHNHFWNAHTSSSSSTTSQFFTSVASRTASSTYIVIHVSNWSANLIVLTSTRSTQPRYAVLQLLCTSPWYRSYRLLRVSMQSTHRFCCLCTPHIQSVSSLIPIK